MVFLVRIEQAGQQPGRVLGRLSRTTAVNRVNAAVVRRVFPQLGINRGRLSDEGLAKPPFSQCI
jgi:hypothetical protein